MGCDIHLKAEVKKDGLWHILPDPTVPCRFCNETGIDERRTEPTVIRDYGPNPEDPEDEIVVSETTLPPKTCYWCRGTKKRQEEWWEGRSYDLFAILANVRNGRGFAGIRTGDGFNPMTEERGVPDDVSAEGRIYLDSYGVDGHSHTYMTLAEILSYDWNQVSWKDGTVSASEFKAWLDAGKKGYPPSYSGGVWGGNVVMIEPELMEEKILKGEITFTEDGSAKMGLGNGTDMLIQTGPGTEVAPAYYTTIRWPAPYSEVRDRSGFSDTIKALKEVAEKEGVTYNDVRLIMFFDN